MSEAKDKIVEELFEIVQKKKEEIKKIEKPIWLTNCSYISPTNVKLGGQQNRNIRAISDVDELTDMVSELLITRDYNIKSREILGLETTTMGNWGGFRLDEWISDIKTRVSIINITIKKKELESLEKRLDKLVSTEKREEMELIAIRKELEM